MLKLYKIKQTGVLMNARTLERFDGKVPSDAVIEEVEDITNDWYDRASIRNPHIGADQVNCGSGYNPNDIGSLPADVMREVAAGKISLSELRGR
jgi:hypothetical protein